MRLPAPIDHASATRLTVFATSGTMNCRFAVFSVAFAGLLLGTSAALAASTTGSSSTADLDSSCQPVIAAMDKAAQTPFHETVSANDKRYEKIQTATALYIGSSGHWRLMASSPEHLSNTVRESGLSITECAPLRKEVIDGESATVYSAQESLASSDENFRIEIWIGDTNGLPLKSESDGAHAQTKTHVSTHYSYTNVQAPSGAK